MSSMLMGLFFVYCFLIELSHRAIGLDEDDDDMMMISRRVV